MIGLGVLILVVTAVAWLLHRRKQVVETRWFLWVSVVAILFPFLANTFGWLFTEMGRQPWIVYGLMKTNQAASPIVGLGSVALTLAGFTVLYTVLGVIDIVLMKKAASEPLKPTGIGGSGGSFGSGEGGAGGREVPGEEWQEEVPSLVY